MWSVGENKIDIENQMNLLMGSDSNQTYQALKALLAISEDSNVLYCYFDQFIEMMNNQNNLYVRMRELRLIAYHSKWDCINQVNLIIDQWLNHIEDEKPITSRQCIKDMVLIAKYKPELSDVICKALETYNKIYKESMQNLIYKDWQKSILQIRQNN